ncbi:hypothetical protein ACWGOQ_0002665 [Aquimarina sp. M1]
MSLLSVVRTLMTNVGNVFESEFDAQKILVSNFLQNEENNIIRLYVVDTSGLGHQATTILIMNRLITLGFNHNFQLVYDNSSGDNKRKLAKLIPGFNAAGEDVQTVILNDNTSVKLITLASFITNIEEYPVVNFGFTGGFDTNATNLANNPSPSSKGVNVNFFLKLQPFQWSKQNAIQRLGQVNGAYIILEDQVALGAASFKKRGYFVNPPQAPLDTDFGDDATKLAAYKKIIAATTGEDATVNLMPVYGIGENRDFGGGVEANLNIKPENVLLYLITGLRYAQEFSEIGHLQQGTIILNIAFETPASYVRLDTYLKGIASADRNQGIDRLNQFVTDIGAVAGDITAANVEVIDYAGGNAEWLQAKIDALKSPGGVNKVLLIKMDGLPLPAFDYIYSKSSASCLFEGKGTANLVLNLNKPYLNLLKNAQNVYPTLPINAVEHGPQSVRSEMAARGLNDSAITTNGKLPADDLVLNPPSEGLTQTGMYKIANFIKDGYTDDGDTQQYFTALQTFWQNQQEDKLFQSLLFFLFYVNGLDE